MPGFSSNKTIAKKVTGKPESVTIVVSPDQIVLLIIPYGTPRAPLIRELVTTKMLDSNNLRMFWFHGEDKTWSNVALTSTEQEPVLAAPPIEAVEKAHSVLSRSPHVSSVSIVDENKQPLTLAQVKDLEFTPLEESAQEEPAATEDDTDELADAVLELKDTAAKNTADVAEVRAVLKHHTMHVADGLATLSTKLSRAEDEVQNLKNEVAELKAALQTALQAAAPAASPATDKTPTEEAAEAEVAGEAEVRRSDPDAAAAAPQLATAGTTKTAGASKTAKPPSRLAAAAAKKRRAAAAGSSDAVEEASEPPAKSARGSE